MVLNLADLDKLEKRARNAVAGYGSDVNITCYVYGKDVLMLLDEVRELSRENDALKFRYEGTDQSTLLVERDKLQAFKDWVHAYLDKLNVPHSPPGGPHGQEGCRIGDRMDWLVANLPKLKLGDKPFDSKRLANLLRPSEEGRT